MPSQQLISVNSRDREKKLTNKAQRKKITCACILHGRTSQLHDSLSLNFKCALHYYPAIAKDCQIIMPIRSQGKKLSKLQKDTQDNRRKKELPWVGFEPIAL